MTKAPIGRKLGQRVKKKKLKASSRQWLQRHINDPYVQRAQLEGYRARAAFKLLEIDDKFRLLKPGMAALPRSTFWKWPSFPASRSSNWTSLIPQRRRS